VYFKKAEHISSQKNLVGIVKGHKCGEHLRMIWFG